MKRTQPTPPERDHWVFWTAVICYGIALMLPLLTLDRSDVASTVALLLRWPL